MDILSSKDLLKQQLEQASKPTPKRVPPVDISKSAGIQYNAFLQRVIRLIRHDINTELVPMLRKTQSEYVTDESHLVMMDSLTTAQSSIVMVDVYLEGTSNPIKPLNEYLPKTPRITTDGYLTDVTGVLERIFAKWTGPDFVSIAGRGAEGFINTVEDTNRKRFNKQMKSFGIDIYGDSPELNELMEAAIYDNTKLIQSIPAQYLKQVESITLTNIRAGNRSSAMVKGFQEQFGVTHRRAKMIARDQTSKANGDMTAKRQQTSGFEYFQWKDVDDSRVRHRHDELSNKVTAYGKGVYRWDNPPLSDDGLPIIPGQDYQCRCMAMPVSNAQVALNVKNGKTKPGVLR